MPSINDSPVRERLSTWQILKFELPGIGSLQIGAAASWKAQPGNLPLTWAFRETRSGPDRLLITVFPLDNKEAAPAPDELWERLKPVREYWSEQIVEKQVRRLSISTRDGVGCFFTVTDRAPKIGEFLYLTSGMVPAGSLLLNFTILTNPDEPILFARALATIRSAIHLPEGVQFQERDDPTPALDETITRFLRIELNSEASLFVQDHPELLEDQTLLILEQIVDRTQNQALHDVCNGARYALLCARAVGMASVLAPGEIIMVPEVLRLIDAVIGIEGPNCAQCRINKLEIGMEEAGTAATLRPWAILHLSLGQELSEVGNQQPEANEKAIEHLKIALNACTQESDVFLRAAISMQLAERYLNRNSGERASNVESVIVYATRALQDLDGSGFVEDWVTAKIRLGLGYLLRIRGDRDRNLENAIECFNRAIVLCPDEKTRNWGAIQLNLGTAFLSRKLGDQYENVKQAIKHLNLALTTRDKTSITWPKLQCALGNAYQRLAAIDVEAMDKAITHYKQALPILSQQDDLFDWARVQHNLGLAYQAREIGDHAENIALAISCFKESLTVITSCLPREHRMSQLALGRLYLSTRQWQEASVAFLAAIAADEALVSMTITRAGSRSEFAQMRHAYSDASYCLLRLERFEDAFVTLEKGKARMLAQALRQSTADEVQSEAVAEAPSSPLSSKLLFEVHLSQLDVMEDRIDTLDKQNQTIFEKTRNELPALLDDVQKLRETLSATDPVPRLADAFRAIPADGALLAPVITQAGTAVFVIKGGSNEITLGDIAWIDGFAHDDLERLLVGTPGVGQPDGWLNAYFQRTKEQNNWRRTLVTIGGVLWRELFDPINARLTEIGLRQEAPLVVLLPGGLNIFPLHAAWRNRDGKKRYAADDYTISYCPSALALANSKGKLLHRKEPLENPSKSMLVVANPTCDLQFAAIEGKVVAAFGDPQGTELLLGNEASWSAVSHVFGKKAYIHFACHGLYNLKDPMRSFLELAPPPELKDATGNIWLLELMGWNTGEARLVTMSACETGISDIMDAPDEYISLSTGWLDAGAIGVISSLWRVDDLCTMLLMERFYQFHLGSSGSSESSSRLGPDAALRAAQLWLKDLSNMQVCERLAALERQSGLSPEQLALISSLRNEYADQPPFQQPFSEIYWWAGFTFAGA